MLTGKAGRCTDKPMSNKLRFTFLAADPFPPLRPDVINLFGKELAGRGHHIAWILTSKDPALPHYHPSWPYGPVAVGGRCAGSGTLTNLWNRWLDFRNDLCLASELRSQNFDFVQLKDKFLAAIPTLLQARWNKLPFIYWLSFPYPEEALHLANERCGFARFTQLIRYRLFRFVLYSCVLPRATHVFVQSSRMKDSLVKEGIDPDRITPVPMGVSLADVPAIPKNSERSTVGRQKPYRLVYLGTLSRLRNLGFLLRVLKLVHRHVPETTLLFVGGGNCQEDERALEREAEVLELTRHITITGQLPRADAWRHVQESDICLSYIPRTPVLDVGSPTKLIEYMALNKVIVANDHPEQREILSQSQAGSCVETTETAFADRIVWLFAHPDEAQAMAARGHSYVKQYRDYTVIADRLEHEYIRILTRQTFAKSRQRYCSG